MVKQYQFNYIKVETNKGWRVYRHQNNIQRKIYFKDIKINGEELLLYNPPRNVYSSVNKFLDYKEHGKTYKFQNKLIEKYSLVDIDGQDFNNKEQCNKYFFEILEFLIKNDIRIGEIIMTNTVVNGFQILINPCSVKPFLQLLENHPKLFSCVDRKVYDEKRIRRLYPYYNGNKGCYPILLYDGGRLDIELVKRMAYALGMPFEANDKEGKRASSLTSPDKILAENPDKRMDSCHFLVKEISSTVNKDQYVPVLKLKSKPSRNYIKKLQKYNIGDLYAFQTHSGYCLIAPKVASKRRLEKIYKSVQCWSSLNELKFKQNWVFVSNIYNIEKNKSEKTLEFLGIYEQKVNGQFSIPHLKFLSKFYKKDYPNLTGKDTPKIYIAHFCG